MAQKIINVGSVANDGTGDTIRGAFTNVNANFTEVYTSVIETGIAFAVANAAFDKTNTVNTLAYSIATSANSYAESVGASANSYATIVGAASNAYAVTVGSSANAYAVSVGSSANAYSLSIGDAVNSYSSILAANNAVGANAWASSVGVASNNWSLSTFATLSNTAIIFNTTNAAFSRSNTAFQNTSGTFSGNLNISGTATALGGFSDALGAVREKLTFTVSGNTTANGPYVTYIANSTSLMHINVLDDNNFTATANVGTVIDIYQLGTGTTKIVANDAAVTVYSANNWANISAQYQTAKIVKVRANTWMLVGNLKA